MNLLNLFTESWLLLLGLLVVASHFCVVARWLWHLWRGGGGTAGGGSSSTVPPPSLPPPPTAAAAAVGGPQGPKPCPQQVTVKLADTDSLERILKKLIELEKLMKQKGTSVSESASHRLLPYWHG